MNKRITTEEEILAALNEPFGNNVEYDSEIEDSDENEIDNIEEDIVEDDIQEVDSEEDYMPSLESESETVLARNVVPPPAKRPRRDIAMSQALLILQYIFQPKTYLKLKMGINGLLLLS
jgi:hypothetical protein